MLNEVNYLADVKPRLFRKARFLCIEKVIKRFDIGTLICQQAW